jgi:hypothetical protein
MRYDREFTAEHLTGGDSEPSDTAEVGPYLVEVDNGGCAHCGADKTWTVVAPDGVAVGQSWMNPDDAEAYASAMNDAFSLGAASERQVGSGNQASQEQVDCTRRSAAPEQPLPSPTDQET